MSWKSPQFQHGWEVETAGSSHDSGYQCSYSSSSYRWPLVTEAQHVGHGQEENHTSRGQGRDLLDSLIFEDVQERIEQMKMSGSSQASLNCLDSLMSGLEISSGRPITGSDRVTPIELNYNSQVSSLSSLMEQDVPLAFPGKSLPVKVKVTSLQHPPAVTSPLELGLNSQGSSLTNLMETEQDFPLTFPRQWRAVRAEEPPPASPVLPAFKLPSVRKVVPGTAKKPRPQSRPQSVSASDSRPLLGEARATSRRRERSSVSSSGDMEEMIAVSHQLEKLVREREKCEQVVTTNLHLQPLYTTRTHWDGQSQLDKLLRDVSDEQDRIRVLVGRVEIITGVRQSKSLHECLARWQAATRQVHTARTDGKVTLASDLVNLSSNIRRIRQGHNQIVFSILASTLQRIFVQSFCDCWDQDPHLDHRQLRPLQIPLGGQTVSKVH